jgi:hypothetical protein
VARLLGVLHALALPAPDPGDPWYTEVQPVPKWTARANEAGTAGLAWADRLRAAQELIAVLTAQVTQPAARGRSTAISPA